MSWIDGAIVSAFLLYALAAGLRYRVTASRHLDDYFLAGRSLSGWQAGLSMAATQFSADTPLLVTGLIATSGIFALWRLWIYAIAFLLMGFVLASSWRRSGALTDAELTEVRYRSAGAPALRFVKAVYFGTIVNWTVLAIVLLAATRVAEPFLLWSEWLPEQTYSAIRQVVEWVGVPYTLNGSEQGDVWIHSTNNLLSIGMILFVTLLYSTTGGLRSVVATDLVQFVIAMIASAVFAWYVVDQAGGLSRLVLRLHEQFPDEPGSPFTASQLLAFTPSEAKDLSASVLTLFGLQWLLQMNADGTGYLAQRTMACRSDHDATQAAVVFTAAQVLLRSLIWLPLGLGLLVLYPVDPQVPENQVPAERESAYVRGINDLLPPGVKGLVLTGMYAAFSSTVDTQLNWGAAYWTKDLYDRFLCRGLAGHVPSARELVWIARMANLLTVAGALMIVPMLSSIQAAWRLSLLFGAGLGPVLVLRWVWWRLTAWGELASVVGAAILSPLALTILPDDFDAARLLLVGAGAMVTAVVVSLSTAPEPMNGLLEFYQKAKPPGFWKPVALVAGEPSAVSLRRWTRGLARTAGAALSVFCLLTAMGSWLVGSPPPFWFPWRAAWIGGLLIIGILLCPIWVPYLTHRAAKTPTPDIAA